MTLAMNLLLEEQGHKDESEINALTYFIEFLLSRYH